MTENEVHQQMECSGHEDQAPAAAITLLQARYALPIVQALLGAPLRFNALHQHTAAASATTLRARLLALQKQGVVTHHGDHYALTSLGQGLQAVFSALGTFHQQHPDHDATLLLTALQRRYAMRIMRELMTGALGFNELHRRVDAASPTTLKRRLTDLERIGLIDRTAHSVMPPRTTYAHSSVGMDFSPVVGHVVQWSRMFQTVATDATPDTSAEPENGSGCQSQELNCPDGNPRPTTPN